MHAFSERHGIEVIHAWGMTEMSPLGSVARRAGRRRPGTRPGRYRYTQGRVPAGGGGAHRRARRRGHAQRRQGRGRAARSAGRGSPAVPRRRTSPDPEKFHDGWLRTGDVGTLSADGYLTLTDRAKDVIKSGGEWISSVELENALMAHPAVLEACVVGRAGRALGRASTRHGRAAGGRHGRRRTSCASSSAARWRSWQLPERWAFIEAVPKTSVGKFDKKRSGPVRRTATSRW